MVYDRATSINSGLFKRFDLSQVTNPVISGHVATDVLPSGQQLLVQTLRPPNASASAAFGASNLGENP